MVFFVENLSKEQRKQSSTLFKWPDDGRFGRWPAGRRAGCVMSDSGSLWATSWIPADSSVLSSADIVQGQEMEGRKK